MMKEFRQFLLHGNVVDLAVGVVAGAAFGSAVNAFVSDILTPLIAAFARIPDFSNLFFTVSGNKVLYGHFFNALLSFFLLAAVIFFFVVKPMNTVRSHKPHEALP